MQLIFILFLAAAAALSGYLVINFSASLLTGFIISASFFFFAFFSPGLSLFILIFSMLLSPEISVGAISSNKQIVIRYDDLILVTIFFSWFARTAILKTKSFIFEGTVFKPLIIYSGILLISTSLGIMRGDIQPVKSFFYLAKYMQYFMLYFMSVNILFQRQENKSLFKYAYIVFLIVCLYSYYYYFSATGADVRASAPFEAPLNNPGESEPASLGGYYLIAMGIFLAAMSEFSGKFFLLSLASFVLIYPSFLLTFSRASYMGFAVLYAAIAVFVKKRKILFLAAAFAGLIVTISLPGVSDKVEARIKSTYEGAYANKTIETPLGDFKVEESAYLRFQSLVIVFKNVLPEHPFLGKGVTGIGLGDNQYALLLGETGLAGFFVFFWLLYTLISMSYNVYSKSEDPFYRALALGFMSATFAFLAHGFGVNTFIIVRIMEPYWFLAAVLTVENLRIKKALKENDGKSENLILKTGEK